MIHPGEGVISMKKQQMFASAAWRRMRRVTRRERFLSEVDRVIPRARLLELIEPHYHRGKTGRLPHDLERMLRIYFLQQWFDLSDPQAEDAIYDSESMRRFAGVELGENKKWLARHDGEGEAGLEDRSRQPHRLRCRTPRRLVERMVRLRRRKKAAWEITAETGVPTSTVSRHLKAEGLGRLWCIEEAEHPPQR
jgi:hypothetical protein